jgi:hypothetical protein
LIAGCIKRKKLAVSLSESTHSILFSKMPFTLTKEHILSFTEPAAHGDWTAFVGAIDPEVKWIIADPIHDTTSLSGTYVRSSASKLFSTSNTDSIESPEVVGSSCGSNGP